MNVVVGLIAILFGGWLIWLTIRRGWHWIYCVLGIQMVVGGAVLLAPVPAFAETRAADVKAWVCSKIPSWKRCPVVRPQAEPPVPLPQARPVESELVREVAPVVAPVLQAPVVREVETVVQPVPRVQPSFDKRSGAEPPKQADRSRLRERSEQEVHRRRLAVEREAQRRREIETGFCFFPISCAKVCEYARAGDSRRGTACQNARGLACVKSTCPEVLKKK